jgi:anthranilate/para-aminobenzoate synthase component II
MILVIDNYDSFTYNLVQYLGELGCELHVYRNDAISINKIRRLKPERILISPGPGVPKDAGITIETIRAFAGDNLSWDSLQIQGNQISFADSREGRVA